MFRAHLGCNLDLVRVNGLWHRERILQSGRNRTPQDACGRYTVHERLLLPLRLCFIVDGLV